MALELRRNQTETGMIPDDSDIEKAIMPWEWYWHDPDRDLNFTIDTVKGWKDQGNLNALSTNKDLIRELEAQYKQGVADKKSSVLDSKQEYVDSLFKQE